MKSVYTDYNCEKTCSRFCSQSLDKLCLAISLGIGRLRGRSWASFWAPKPVQVLGANGGTAVPVAPSFSPTRFRGPSYLQVPKRLLKSRHLPRSAPCYFQALYVRMYVCTYVCTYVCMHACMHACMHVCICVCIYIYIYTCMYACMYVRTYVRMYICMYVGR